MGHSIPRHNTAGYQADSGRRCSTHARYEAVPEKASYF